MSAIDMNAGETRGRVVYGLREEEGGRYSLFRGVYQLQNYSPEGSNPQRDSTEIVIKIKQLYHG